MNVSSFPDLEQASLVIHAFAGFYMTGIIWFVQVAFYPLLKQIGPATFTRYHQSYTTRAALVIGPVMLIELGAALYLLFFSPVFAGSWPAAGGGALLVLAWLSTFTLQVPCHARLEKQWDKDVWRRLVRTNWIRTAAWTLRAVIIGFWMMPN